jgi:hypothetical protein
VTKFHPRRQGDLGEATAIRWLTSIGAVVAFPLFHSPDYDLIADLGRGLFRVQVKTSSCRHAWTDHFAVQLATSGGNQSWNGVVKKFDSSRFDFLFVVVEDGRRWFIPSSEIGASHQISLGGEKYSEFQVGRAEPLDQPYSPRSTLPGRRGGAGVGEPGRTVNPVAQPEWVRFPPPPFLPLHADESSGSRQADTRAVDRTRLSANHQLTIPRATYEAAELRVGDRLRVEAIGKGRVAITRLEEYLARESAGTERRSPG